MLLRPDEITNLKKGRQINVEIKEEDVRVLKRNFCGVYELFYHENPRRVEYFEDLNLFKNRYGSVHKKFPLHNISRQRLDIYPVIENMGLNDMFRWFSEYGKLICCDSTLFDGIEIEYYKWISNTENTVSKFQVIKDGKENGQGIAYLDDGTMIVVDGWRKFIGENLEVIVTSVLQTAAGRMIFAKPKAMMEKAV
jgi:hypothetical protein